MHGRGGRWKALLTKRNIKALEHQEFWDNVRGLLKVEPFGRHRSFYLRCNAITAFHNGNFIPTVKHGGGSMWGCFTTAGPGRLAVNLYHKILDENVIRP